MPKQVRYRGLCLTCNNAADCTFSKDPDRPVVQCEEFDGYEHPPPKILAKQDSVRDAPACDSGSTKNDDENKFVGLCKTCDERNFCMFTKPEGGIWRCEEYR